jgi:hypothetical protein
MMPHEAPDAPNDRAEIHAAPSLAVPLRAGPLRLVFDRGELRWIRLGEREVLRGIYAAVRETGWATVPAVLEDLEIHAEPESFRISFVARHRRGDVVMDWRAQIEGTPEGRIAYVIDGTAGSSFLRNRIGFCVLHPAAECAGQGCVVESVDGRRLTGAFPRLVSPQQPFLDVRAITHEVAPGVEAEVRMDGETFETEDQRNWSDVSFKTYCTPLARPFPVEVKAGTRVQQTVSLRLFGLASEPVRIAAAGVPGALPHKRNSAEPVIVRVESSGVLVRPAIGLAGAGLVPPAAAEAAALRRLGLDHLRADLRLDEPGWEAALERATACSRLLEAPLEAALFLPDEPLPVLEALASRAAALRARVSHWLLFRAVDLATHEGDVALARAVLARVDPGARFGGGVDRYFADLNRRRPPAAGLDRLSFSLNPQVHAFDDATLLENLASLPWTAETARSFAGAASLGLSPVTLRPRVDPRPAASRRPDEPPFSDDPRQRTAFAAAWTLGFVASAAAAGYASLTFFELHGPRGVLEADGPFPVYHALADVLALRGGAVVPSHSRRPERVQALALREGARTRLFLANVGDEAHPVRVEGLAGPARCAALGDPGAGEDSGFELELLPQAIVRLDAEAGA